METPATKTFFNDLRAAVRAGVKMEIGESESPSRALTIGKIDQLQAKAAEGAKLPSRFEAAIETWQKTGSMIPVFEGLSTKIESWHRISKLFHKSLLYVFAVAILAIVALVWFQLNVLPEINAVRKDLITIAQPTEEIGHTDFGLIANITLIVFSLLLLTLVGWLLRGGVARAGWWLGAGTWMRYRTLATAAQTLQGLVANGEAPMTAATISGKLAGLCPEGQGELLGSIKELDRETIVSSEWSDYLQMMAQQQYITTRTWGPAVMIVVVGGLFTLLYVTLAYWPITSLLYELSHNTRL